MKVSPARFLKGTLKVPGDKSISHRAVMLGSIAKGTTIIHNFLEAADCLSTISCFKQMGILVTMDNNTVQIKGQGLRGLRKPSEVLDVGNSGTTMRLLSGILCGQEFESSLTGDASIIKRPMGRIIKPLSMMGANIKSKSDNDLAPLFIKPSELHPIDYISPIASAQVKSSIILASLYTKGISTITEPYISRNHSEIMLNHFGAHIETDNTKVICNPVDELYANEVIVPSDISSAAYFMVAGLLSSKGEIVLKDVGINPTRDGIIKVLKNMNGNIEFDNVKIIGGEKTADIIIRPSSLTGTIIEGSIIPTLIDEIPVIAVAAAFAEGQTIIKDATELKVKESNRIQAMVTELSKMGVSIEETNDGMIITGGSKVYGAVVESYNDHRVAMSLSIAALNAESETVINNDSCIKISYPSFFENLKGLIY